MRNSNLIIGFLIVSIAVSCNSNESNEETQYEFLLTCYEDYYLNYDLELTPVLAEFEKELIKEGHLKDDSGKSYKSLLNYLKKNNYFRAPLNKSDFDEVLLYKTPNHIAKCGISVFGLDSSDIAQTTYFKAERKITNVLEEKEEVSINLMFDIYSKAYSHKDLEKPLIKESILILFYRWYFQSKYEQEEPDIDNSKKENVDSTKE